MAGSAYCGVVVTSRLIAEAEEYGRLVDEARELGIPTSLDDPRSPRTIDALRLAVAARKGEGS